MLRAIDSDLLDQRFLPILLRSPLAAEYLENHFTGSVNRFLNWKPLAAWEFDLPPLDQQKRIADLLWAVECHLNSLYESSIQQEEAYVAFRSSLLLGSYISPERDALSRPHAIPSTWRMVGISDLATVRAGATPLRREHSRYFDGGTIPWVKSLDLNEGTILETEERITDVAFKESSVVRVPAGTVLVAMYGGFKQIGRTGVLGVEGTTNQAVSAILNLRNDVRPAYLHEALKAGRNSWRLVAASTRKDPNITKKDVERFSFPLPR
jgi:type I restriction enzyme S subunit